MSEVGPVGLRTRSTHMERGARSASVSFSSVHRWGVLSIQMRGFGMEELGWVWKR